MPQDSPEILVPSEIYSPQSDQVVYYTRPRHRYWLHLLLLFATVFTTLVVGAHMEANFQRGLSPLAFGTDDGWWFPINWAVRDHNLLLGVPFSLTLMLILLAHEMGHYLYCLKYRVDATLPFFIPFPTLIGTLGAFIRIRSPLRARAILFDIGIAGPIAGFAVALPVLLFSLGRSHIAPVGAASPDISLGYPFVFYLVRNFLVAAGHGSAIASVPLDRLYLDPVAVAAWVGMFATSLNLLPGGQLDGGHILFAVSPRAHRHISRLTILALIPLALFCWPGWLLWAVLLRLTGRHPEVMKYPTITPARRWLAGFALIMLALTFSYAPIGQQALLGSPRSLLNSIRHWHIRH